jgi:hypothetical protein
MTIRWKAVEEHFIKVPFDSTIFGGGGGKYFFYIRTAVLKELKPHSLRTSVLKELKPHCIRCCHFKVDDVSALEAISKPPVRIVEDNVTASLHQQCTP